MSATLARLPVFVKKPILAITQGDVCGIGPEIIAKAFRAAPDLLHGCFVVGDVAAMRWAAALVQDGGPALPVASIETPAQALQAPPDCIPVLQAVPPMPVLPHGRICAQAGQAAGDCVTWAARAALRGEVAGLVTAPLHKEALAAAGQPYAQYPGHTELLQALAADHSGLPLQQMPVRMMLANDELRVVLLSIHVSLQEAIAQVNQPNIVQTLHITHQFLTKALGRPPRLAVAGLNPHAGEGGRFGREEIDTIAPAVAAARAQGMDVQGPLPPDTVFMRARHTPQRPGAFDAVIALYHDQGLIPIKYLGVEQGVNITLGLPLLRTSPDHGTAFDIAGTGQADPASLLAAVRMARTMSAQVHHPLS